INKGVKCVIPERIMSIESTSTFFDLFDLTMMGQYDDREVKVSIRQEKSEGWKKVDKGLDGDLKILEVLGFMQVKFCLVSDTNLDTTVSTQNRPNAFDILMTNSRQLLLPQLILEVLSLNRILKKYSDYLITTTANINELHYSNESAQNPGNNSTMYQVSACEPHQLKDEYTQLDDTIKVIIWERLTTYGEFKKKVTPAVLRLLHFDLTGNAAVTSDAVSRDVEERLKLMLTLADPNIIFDL
ncbi:520_t:CDS:2, partial [Racocetra fulgida]